MYQQLINHSQDLKRLRDEGYEIEIKGGGYLLIHHIPYVNHSKEIKFGVLVSELTLKDNLTTSQPSTHVIHFIGEHPCNKNGELINPIQHASQNQILREDLVINHSFSNKPPEGYSDYYQKISRYIDIISAPAKSIDKSVTAKTFKVIPDDDVESVFNYIDTNSSRANIENINSKLKNQKIAIIGLGGTGSYILDLIAKTPTDEIHLYDGDSFEQHNAFRSPGAASIEQLKRHMSKVGYLTEVYSKMRKGIVPHAYFIDDDNYKELDNKSFVFICVDSNNVRKGLIQYLLKNKVKFIDVGLGVNIVDDRLIGTLRVTLGTASKRDHLHLRIPTADNDNNDYGSNIQIADLNALNATLAVIKWKKELGFYQDLVNEHHCTYSINDAFLNNEDNAA